MIGQGVIALRCLVDETPRQRRDVLLPLLDDSCILDAVATAAQSYVLCVQLAVSFEACDARNGRDGYQASERQSSSTQHIGRLGPAVSRWCLYRPLASRIPLLFLVYTSCGAGPKAAALRRVL